MKLTTAQRAAIAADGSIFLLGPVGTGKSTALHQRLQRLLREGEPAYTVLVLVAEAEDREKFLAQLQDLEVGPYADLQITTYTYLARRMVYMFWPLVAGPAGFDRPYQPPVYLHYDLAQILMWEIVRPMLQEGAFADLRLRPQQIVSQLIDTLNRAALNRLTLEEAYQRQRTALAQDGSGARHLAEGHSAVRRFRQHCREHSFLDVSLAVRVFDTQLLQHPEFNRYFGERFRHMIVDNVEEQTPAGQQFIANLMSAVRSTALAYDEYGGYKRLLSADPDGALGLRERAGQTLTYTQRFTTRPAVVAVAKTVDGYLSPSVPHQVSPSASDAILGVIEARYRHEMIGQSVDFIDRLLQQGDLAASDVAIIAPGLDEALMFTLSRALRDAGIPYTVLQRRSVPRDVPQVRAWLTWLKLAHPEWEMPPDPFDVTEAFSLTMSSLDPARAALLTQAFYDPDSGSFGDADQLSPEIVDRVGHEHIAMAQQLAQWLSTNTTLTADRFLHALYTELLAHPPFQPTPDPVAAGISEWLVQLTKRLREAGPQMSPEGDTTSGRLLIRAIVEGLVAADPPPWGEPLEPAGVTIATIYGYLLNQEVDRVQVWLDVSSVGWWDIPRQPLSNVFVLGPTWPAQKPWTMEDDFYVRNQLLQQIIYGLAGRCGQGIVLATSTLDRRGQRQEGPLWRALYPLLAPQSVP